MLDCSEGPKQCGSADPKWKQGNSRFRDARVSSILPGPDSNGLVSVSPAKCSHSPLAFANVYLHAQKAFLQAQPKSLSYGMLNFGSRLFFLPVHSIILWRAIAY